STSPPPSSPPRKRGGIGHLSRRARPSLQSPAARLYGRQGGQFRGQLVGRIGRHLVFGQGDQRHADFGGAGGTIDQAGGGDNVGADAPETLDAFANRQAGRHDILDDDDLFTRRQLEAPPEFEASLDAFGVDRRQAEMASRLVARDNAADRWRHHLGDIAESGSANLFGQGAAEFFRLVGVHEDPRLLQEYRRPQARGQDEMSFEDGAALAEDAQNFVSIQSATPARYRRAIPA